MALDVSAGGALGGRLSLQDRVREASHAIFAAGKSASAFQADIRSYLFRASDLRLIVESQEQIRKLVVMSPPPTDIPDATQSIGTPGPRNFNRDPALPHFTRACDGATFDFQVSVRDTGRELVILAYGFELRFPDGGPVGFLRFDLSPPKHKNTENGLRSHIHLGSDDDGFSIPAPMLSPFEVFDFFLHLMQPGERRRT